MNELWQCCNTGCWHIGPLNQQGRCALCDSNAVISQALLTMAEWHKFQNLKEIA